MLRRIVPTVEFFISIIPLHLVYPLLHDPLYRELRPKHLELSLNEILKLKTIMECIEILKDSILTRFNIIIPYESVIQQLKCISLQVRKMYSESHCKQKNHCKGVQLQFVEE